MAATDTRARLLIEAEPRSGAWNMAFDEALLEAAVDRGQVALRIYRWAEPTLSLGYFQRIAPADLPEPLRAVRHVRRLSGGGAILHDREWTYSCVVPKGHALAAKPELLYEEAHAALVRALAQRGVVARPRGTNDRAADRAFLCFRRGDERDLLIGAHKIVGSAQRRRRGAVLQHGSVLLRETPLAPAVPGIFDLSPGAGGDPFFAVSEFVADLSPKLFDRDVLNEADPLDIAYADAHQSRYVLVPAT